MKVIFSHGKESGPWGTKIQMLSRIVEEEGYWFDSIDYTKCLDVQERVEILRAIISKEDVPILLVGSSMGGYVSTVLSNLENVKGLFLMAPALYMQGYPIQEYPIVGKPVDIVHGWGDDIIPYTNSIRYASKGLYSLHLIDGDHRLSTSYKELGNIFRMFLQSRIKG